MKEMRKAYFLICTSERKIQLGRQERRWEDNIKMDLEK
jgi:hypothetical protein